MKLKINFKNRFWGSCGKVGLLLIFIFLPLLFNIVLAVIPAEDKMVALTEKIIPGEMIAYCIGLIAPLFVLLLKTHGNSFKIPALKPMFIIAFSIYFLTIIISLIAKNKLINGIDLKPGHTDLYFWVSILFVVCAIFLRIYTDFQDSRYSDFKKTLDKQQQEFTNTFRNSLG